MEDETLVEEIIENPVEDPMENPVADPEPEGDPVTEDPGLDPEPVEDPSDEIFPEDVIEEEEPVEVLVPEELPGETLPGNEVLEHEDSEKDFTEIFPSGEEDLSGYRTISLTQLDLLEIEQSGDVPSVMAEVVESVLGEYQRMTYTVEEYDAGGNLLGTSTEYVPGLAGLDYAWITGAILFAIFIGGIFKLLGGLMRL